MAVSSAAVVGPETSEWEQLVAARLAAGDRFALADTYDQYGGFVYGLARRVTRDDAAAEEVSQGVFLSLWERPAGYVPERGSLRAYLGVLTHRRAVDWLRREAAARRRSERTAPVSTIAVPDVAEAATAVLVAERVRAAVEQLPDEQRAAIQLAYFEGMTYRQVAATLEIPEGTAKSRLRLALARLASALEAEGSPS